MILDTFLFYISIIVDTVKEMNLYLGSMFTLGTIIPITLHYIDDGYNDSL